MALYDELLAGNKQVKGMPSGAGGASSITGAAEPSVTPASAPMAAHPVLQAATAAANTNPDKQIPLTDPGDPQQPGASLPGSYGSRVMGRLMDTLGTAIGGNDYMRERTPDELPNRPALGMPVSGAPAPGVAAAPAPTPAPAPAPAAATTVPLAPGVAPGLPALAPAMSTPGTDALPTAGAPAPTSPTIGTVTMGGKEYAIPATGPTGAPGGKGGYAGAVIGGAPTGPVDSNGNGTTRTTELKAQLEAQRGEQAQLAQRDQQSLAGDMASRKAMEDSQSKWEADVADSSIMNRPSQPMGTPAQMQAQIAMAQMQQQEKNARRQNQGMLRGQDIGAATAREGHQVQLQGQQTQADVATQGQRTSADTARSGQQVQAEGHRIAADTSAANTALSAQTQLATNALTNQTSAANNAATNKTHLESAKVAAKAQAEHAALVQQGWKPSTTMPGTYYRTGPNGEPQEYNAAMMAASKGAPKKG